MFQVILLLSLCLVARCFNIDSKSNVAVYWGQNSGGGQTRLADYCDSPDMDIFLLSFLYSFPNNLQLDFANQCSDSFSSGLRKCDQIGEDIKYCQKKGKIVLLSMGGAVGNYGFSSDDEATKFSKTLWNKFAGGEDDERPFGDAVVDGFDFDFEQNQQTGTVALGKGLRSQFSKDSSKKYYLAAAPQCPYPDASVGDVLEEVELDFAFIQFYNNYCNLGSNFNWDTWQDYASNTSPNKDIKLFLGQPGGATGASSGFNSMDTVSKYVSQIEGSKNFGGISLWDASQALATVDNGNDYAKQLKSVLEKGDNSGKLVEKSSSESKATSTPKTSSTTSSATFTASEPKTTTSSKTEITTSSSTKYRATSTTKETTSEKVKSSSTDHIQSDITSTVVTSSEIEDYITENLSSQDTSLIGTLLVKTITHTAPTTITTVRFTGTVTEIATKHMNPPDY